MRSIHWAVNDTPAEVTNLPTELLWGDDAIEEELGGLRFRVRPNAFLQTNTRMAERLYELAREEAALTGSETVYDLYCGIGTIGLSLARDAMTVWGVEISEESVACAIENAELNSIGNAAFFAGNVGEVLRELRERAGEPDVVVVDPPRAGLAGKALERLGELAAPRIVYVSCNPTTLAGDAKRLRRGLRLPPRPHDRRSTCSRTRRTSSRCRCSSGQRTELAVGTASGRARRRSRRQSRSAFGSRKPSEMPGARAGRRGPTRPRRCIVSAEAERDSPTQVAERPQAEADRSRPRKTREEEHVGQAELGRASARDDEGERDARRTPPRGPR